MDIFLQVQYPSIFRPSSSVFFVTHNPLDQKQGSPMSEERIAKHESNETQAPISTAKVEAPKDDPLTITAPLENGSAPKTSLGNSKTTLIMIALYLAVFLTAIDTVITTTALPPSPRFSRLQIPASPRFALRTFQPMPRPFHFGARPVTSSG